LPVLPGDLTHGGCRRGRFTRQRRADVREVHVRLERITPIHRDRDPVLARAEVATDPERTVVFRHAAHHGLLALEPRPALAGVGRAVERQQCARPDRCAVGTEVGIVDALGGKRGDEAAAGVATDQQALVILRRIAGDRPRNHDRWIGRTHRQQRDVRVDIGEHNLGALPRLASVQRALDVVRELSGVREHLTGSVQGGRAGRRD
jgi:hypothetical protein